MRKNIRMPWEQFTVVKCEKCGEFYEASLKHVCKKENSYPMKFEESEAKT